MYVYLYIYANVTDTLHLTLNLEKTLHTCNFLIVIISLITFQISSFRDGKLLLIGEINLCFHYFVSFFMHGYL